MKVYVIPHFHYDVVWVETERSYLKRVYKIIENILDIMDSDNNFKYTLDQTYYLEKLKKEKPKLFKQLADKVREGRIEIVNGGYVMPDLNLVSPQTIKKSFELANEFALKEFGIKPKVAWMIDCFGHNGLMPKIAKEVGLNYYVFWRGMINESSTQDFIWEGIDGTRIIAHWMKFSYSLFPYVVKSLEEAIRISKPTTENIFIPFGADFYVPEEKFINEVYKIKEAKFATPSEFFEEIEKNKEKLPIVKGEMLSDYYNFRGVYSSRIRYKQLFREVEKSLFSGNNNIEDKDWKELIYCSFHDLICGTGIDKVYSTAIGKLNKLKRKYSKKEEEEKYMEKTLENIYLQLSLESGDLYHTKPKPICVYKLEKLKTYSLSDGSLEIYLELDFKLPQHKLQLVIDSGINNGVLLHNLGGYWIERSLNRNYPLTDYFEYWDEKKERKMVDTP